MYHQEPYEEHYTAGDVEPWPYWVNANSWLRVCYAAECANGNFDVANTLVFMTRNSDLRGPFANALHQTPRAASTCRLLPEFLAIFIMMAIYLPRSTSSQYVQFLVTGLATVTPSSFSRQDLWDKAMRLRLPTPAYTLGEFSGMTIPTAINGPLKDNHHALACVKRIRYHILNRMPMCHLYLADQLCMRPVPIEHFREWCVGTDAYDVAQPDKEYERILGSNPTRESSLKKSKLKPRSSLSIPTPKPRPSHPRQSLEYK